MNIWKNLSIYVFEVKKYCSILKDICLGDENHYKFFRRIIKSKFFSKIKEDTDKIFAGYIFLHRQCFLYYLIHFVYFFSMHFSNEDTEEIDEIVDIFKITIDNLLDDDLDSNDKNYDKPLILSTQKCYIHVEYSLDLIEQFAKNNKKKQAENLLTFLISQFKINTSHDDELQSRFVNILKKKYKQARKKKRSSNK